FEQASRKQKEDARGILDLFSALGDEDKAFEEPPKIDSPMSKEEILAKEKELLGFYLTGHPMDAYKELIEQLGSQPFHEIDELPHGSVCRSAFIIESLKVKISAKTQRKFAILIISDGMERFELPIWPDLYEEKAPLFHENRLLFAILQVERENDSLRLRCRAVEDLSELSEDQVKTLNTIFDQVKGMAKTEAKRKKKQTNQVDMQEKEQKLHLVLEADQTRFSQIVKLKKLFHRFPGSASVAIAFHASQQRVGTLEIESKWGVGINEGLKNELQNLSFIQSFSFEE
ncbi:MAG: DNA polymerase III subunit alpha, partial [Simkania sp.]|nr:DNA polymerase III subunit alpha [Simkania sp.]